MLYTIFTDTWALSCVTSLLIYIGATLEIITDRSQEGSQFVKGFGGIGGKFLM